MLLSTSFPPPSNTLNYYGNIRVRSDLVICRSKPSSYLVAVLEILVKLFGGKVRVFQICWLHITVVLTKKK